MKVLLSWLREFCPVDLSAEELADVLTSKGAKVEAVERPWDGLRGVVAARVLEVRDHPDAERLCVARVDTGTGELEVVVGVRNMGPGDLVPLAPPGARVPMLAEPLARREIRGVVSNGMLCSPRELGLSQDHASILVLPPDTPLGADVRSHFGLDDEVLDIEVKSNRPDLLSVVGVAREVAAATGVPLIPPEAPLEEGDEKAADAATVEILDLERCPQYLARVIAGVRVGPSPLRAQARLTASGMRPLSNVVDATNYVLLEIGHPLHPFDLALLTGSGIVVRRAGAGERLVTLDGVERVLTEDDLVIADRGGGVAIAGILGAAVAEVSEGTRDVLLESAYFEPVGIGRTSRRLGLRTEASVRFERGADPEAVPWAADRAGALMAAWSGGTVLAGVVEAGRAPKRRRLRVRPERASLVLGIPETAALVRESLERLGIPAEERGGAVEADVPGFRPDLQGEVDLIEEVIRTQGYGRLPETLPRVRQAGELPDRYRLRRRIREALVRAGLSEAISYSFASRRDLDLMGHGAAVRVANPLSAEEEFLRTSLIPGLLRAVVWNRFRQVRSVALFEVGRVFHPGEPVEEREMAALAVAGPASPGFPEAPRDMDFFDAKGAVETALEALGVEAWAFRDGARGPYHPARAAVVTVGGESAGTVGELDPRVAERLDIDGRVGLAELDVEVLARHARPGVTYREIPRFPPVHRDLAFVVDEGTPAGAVRASLVAAAHGLVDSCVLFDVFRGHPIAPGKKSLAFSVDFRAPDRTLTDEEADRAVRRIVERLSAEFGAELRSG